ncbi:MAG TPA: hypothetical protein VEO54_22125 [Thermoanaerobaculia bacterium]|nr:hypothetical protein [Thermoanaerobaculia bacterium]
MTTPDPEHSHAPHEPSLMPRWVPVLIGVVLVAIAALAVYTGLRGQDDDTLLAKVRPRRQQANTPAPPGEPGAGASLVLHGAQGENTPAANEPVQGQSRAVVTGGPGGVSSTMRAWARRGMVLNVLPEDTMVHVNDMPIGQVSQLNTMDEAYEFAAAGSYTVKLVAPSGAEKTYVVTASEDAKEDVVRISVDLSGVRQR